jgi:hypothetical protein
MLSSIFLVLNIGQLYVFVHTVGEILIHIPFSKKNLVHEKSIESNCKKGRHGPSVAVQPPLRPRLLPRPPPLTSAEVNPPSKP